MEVTDVLPAQASAHMQCTLLDWQSSERIGARFRRLRSGPEAALVDAFLEKIPFEVPDGCELVAFREPRLASGFPDLVLIVWHPEESLEWDATRATLTLPELRVLQLVVQMGVDQEPFLTASTRQTKRALERLQSVGLVESAEHGWQLSGSCGAYAVRNIIAIEAKVSKWRAAAHQAQLNTWFAHESYVLMSGATSSHPLVESAPSLGIGVVSNEGVLARAPLGMTCNPKSYVSWLFNEWVWRARAGQA
jgi:hypothetical protein